MRPPRRAIEAIISASTYVYLSRHCVIVAPAIWICNIFLPDCHKFGFSAVPRDVTSARSSAKKGPR
jgi:hypothetical protein